MWSENIWLLNQLSKMFKTQTANITAAFNQATGISITVSPEAPINPIEGTIWFKVQNVLTDDNIEISSPSENQNENNPSEEQVLEEET